MFVIETANTKEHTETDVDDTTTAHKSSHVKPCSVKPHVTPTNLFINPEEAGNQDATNESTTEPPADQEERHISTEEASHGHLEDRDIDRMFRDRFMPVSTDISSFVSNAVSLKRKLDEVGASFQTDLKRLKQMKDEEVQKSASLLHRIQQLETENIELKKDTDKFKAVNSLLKQENIALDKKNDEKKKQLLSCLKNMMSSLSQANDDNEQSARDADS